MEHSDQLNEIAAALCKAQTKLEGAKRDSSNPFFKSKYADLASVWEACKPVLSENGLSVTQFCLPSDGNTVNLTTMLLHSSGQFISGTMTMPLGKADPQGYGSAMTYARRYGLAAIVGVCPEDDDGEGAMRRLPEDRADIRPAQATAPNQKINEGPDKCKCGAPPGMRHATKCDVATG